jgi:hypothetical protein
MHHLQEIIAIFGLKEWDPKIEWNWKRWNRLIFYYLDYKNNNEMKYDEIDFISYHHFILNFIPSNLEGKRCIVIFLLFHYKLSKQWNNIFISFRFILFHSFYSNSLYSIIFHQFKQRLNHLTYLHLMI